MSELSKSLENELQETINCSETEFNEETLDALKEVEEMKKQSRGNYKSYSDAQEMIDDILSEED